MSSIEGSFFRFSDNSSRNAKFTYAVKVIPKSNESMFTCKRCGRTFHRIEGEFDVVLEGGHEFPDVLGCGAFPYLIISENAVRILEGRQIYQFDKYRVGIADIFSSRVKTSELVSYYRIEIKGSCRIDFKKSNIEVIEFCESCHYLVTNPMVPRSFRIVPGSWDGSHMFRDEVHYPRVYFCDAYVSKIARDYKITNFRFEPMVID